MAQPIQPTPGAPAGEPTTPPATPAHIPVTFATPAPTPPPPAPTPPPPAPADPWANYTWDGQVDSLPEPIARVIRDARADAGKARTTAKELAAQEAREQLARDIGLTLGLISDNEPIDPAQLTEQLQRSREAAQAAQVDAYSAQIELDVHRTATRLGADAGRLLDSRTFCDEIDNLEFNSLAEFAAQVEAKVRAALDRDPTLRVGQAPPAAPQLPAPSAPQAPGVSGAEITGGTGGQPITLEQLRGMTPDEIAKAYEEGRLRHLL